MAIEDIKNFLELTPNIATAGQPTEAQLSSLPAAGYKHVVNLGLLDPRYCLADESGLVKSLGLAYRHIPVDFQNPTLHDFEQFVAHMDELQDEKVLVHCAANYRVTTFVCLYAQLRWQWSESQANALMSKWWQPNDVWSHFATQVRQAYALSDIEQ